jgi:hypothetical protein
MWRIAIITDKWYNFEENYLVYENFFFTDKLCSSEENLFCHRTWNQWQNKSTSLTFANEIVFCQSAGNEKCQRDITTKKNHNSNERVDHYNYRHILAVATVLVAGKFFYGKTVPYFSIAARFLAAWKRFFELIGESSPLISSSLLQFARSKESCSSSSRRRPWNEESI